MKGEAEWDEVFNIPHATYNFFPNSQSQESAFFLMFCRDIYIPTLADLPQPELGYLDKSSLLSIEVLREAHMSEAINFKMAGDRQPSKITKYLLKFKVGDLVLLKKIIRSKIGTLTACLIFIFAKLSMIKHMIYKIPLVMLDALL